MKNKTVAIIQARMSSSRLPGKVLLPVCGRPLILLMLDRVKRSQLIDEIWVACSDEPSDDPLAEVIQKEGINCFRGSENDVLDRFLQASKKSQANIIVRLTGDCPLIDPLIIDEVISTFQEAKGKLDYASNCIDRTYPDGLDVEVFSYKTLEKTTLEAKHPFLRQHVTPYMHGQHQKPIPSGNFKTGCVKGDQNFSHLRWTVDEKEDYELVKKIFESLLPVNKDFTWLDVISLQERKPELFKINDKYRCNEGADRDWAKMSNYKVLL